MGIFHEEEGDKLHWERKMGMTPNIRTGPSFDHTTFSRTGKHLLQERDQEDFLINFDRML